MNETDEQRGDPHELILDYATAQQVKRQRNAELAALIGARP